MNRNSYAAIAPFYDLEYGHVTDDIDFYAALARSVAGPVLDGGTGTGRVAAGLARAGHTVTGIEASPELLARARARRRGALARRLDFVEADLRNFMLDRRYGLAVLALNTFAHLLTVEDQLAALACLHRHLNPGGLLAITVENPYPWVTALPQNEVVWGWTKAGPGADECTTMSFATALDLPGQIRSLELWYDVTAADGVMRRHQGSFDLRWFYPTELRLLLERSGFTVQQTAGSYDLAPLDGESQVQIFIAKRQK